MTSLEPAVAALLGLMLLDEHLSLVQWLAIGCIMAAAAGSAASVRREVSRSDAQEIVM
jgi:inner membrane transporter RhtA